MAGHSHWANIQRTKSANDAKRGKLWSKIARRIIVAAKAGGGNPEENLQLRYAIDEARQANMPKDTIAKAIKKGTGELQGEDYENVVYEGYGPGGTAFIIDCLTDNRNRTAPEMRKIFERGGGQLGTSNCVAWMFEQKGRFYIDGGNTSEDQLMDVALDAGAEDIQQEDGLFIVFCEPGDFQQLKQALAEAEIPTESAEVGLVPNAPLEVDADTARSALKLMELFEDHDDTQKVYTNFDIPDELVAEIQSGN
jgi:YebC/PmpR family DNA-binding regulatory protein